MHDLIIHRLGSFVEGRVISLYTATKMLILVTRHYSLQRMDTIDKGSCVQLWSSGPRSGKRKEANG